MNELKESGHVINSFWNRKDEAKCIDINIDNIRAISYGNSKSTLRRRAKKAKKIGGENNDI